jgi:lysyl-tRNA synthetase class I
MYEYILTIYEEISKLESLYNAAMENNSFHAALGARKNIQTLRQEVQALKLEGADIPYEQSCTIVQTAEEQEQVIYC